MCIAQRIQFLTYNAPLQVERKFFPQQLHLHLAQKARRIEQQVLYKNLRDKALLAVVLVQPWHFCVVFDENRARAVSRVVVTLGDVKARCPLVVRIPVRSRREIVISG